MHVVSTAQNTGARGWSYKSIKYTNITRSEQKWIKLIFRSTVFEMNFCYIYNNLFNAVTIQGPSLKM